MNINKSREFSEFNIDRAEDKYSAIYVGQFSPYEDADFAVDVFYQTNPPVKTYSHYFKVFKKRGLAFIGDAASIIKDMRILTIEADDGEIIYSRFRHDYRESKDKTVTIDGGRCYSITSSKGKLRTFIIVDGVWVEEIK